MKDKEIKLYVNLFPGHFRDREKFVEYLTNNFMVKFIKSVEDVKDPNSILITFGTSFGSMLDQRFDQAMPKRALVLGFSPFSHCFGGCSKYYLRKNGYVYYNKKKYNKT